MLETRTDCVKDGERAVSITRDFGAPRERVFPAWIDPEQLARWYAPAGCSIRFTRLEPRADGEFHSCITTPDGHECWCKGVYREVVAPARLVYSLCVADAKGNLVEPTAAGMDPEWPRETILTVTFEERGGGTRLTLQQSVSEALAVRTGAHPSWLQMLDNLEQELAL